MAWFFNNANKISSIKIIIVTLTILSVTGIIFVLTQKTRKMIKNLEVFK